MEEDKKGDGLQATGKTKDKRGKTMKNCYLSVV